MRPVAFLILTALPLLAVCCSRPPAFPLASGGRSDRGQVIGIHLLGWTSDSLLVELGRTIPALAAKGTNLIVLEVDYSFDFRSHPELRQGDQYITRSGAQQFAAICRQHGIRLVPQFQSLGHQSWARHTFPLLTRYPELDLTPGAFPDNQGVYCREWDVTNPRVNQIVFPLIDEIVEAFGADAVHVGMDEVFLLGSEQSPNTRGKDPAALFARAVSEFHDHFVREKGLEIFMWGDRLIDGTVHPYGSWESSHNGTAGAVDLIPKDIVICDWHYEPMRAYPSVPVFLAKGFRVLPCSWRNLEAVAALTKYSYSLEHPNMIGHLFTTWSRPEPDTLMAYPPMVTGTETIRSGRYFDVDFSLASVSSQGELEVALAAPAPGLQVHYTIDGSDPTPRSPRYELPVHLERSAVVKAIACRQGAVVSDVRQKEFVVHRATGRPIALAVPPSPKYPPQGGAAALVNGVTGSASYADGQWVGAEGWDLEAVIDLGAATEVSSVTCGSLRNPSAWVHRTPLIEASASADGQAYGKVGEAAPSASEEPIARIRVAFLPVSTRYLKVLVHNQVIPEGFDGTGKPAWLFVDEIVVE